MFKYRHIKLREKGAEGLPDCPVLVWNWSCWPLVPKPGPPEPKKPAQEDPGRLNARFWIAPLLASKQCVRY